MCAARNLLLRVVDEGLLDRERFVMLPGSIWSLPGIFALTAPAPA
jgi:hypothetical protein